LAQQHILVNADLKTHQERIDNLVKTINEGKGFKIDLEKTKIELERALKKLEEQLRQKVANGKKVDALKAHINNYKTLINRLSEQKISKVSLVRIQRDFQQKMEKNAKELADIKYELELATERNRVLENAKTELIAENLLLKEQLGDLANPKALDELIQSTGQTAEEILERKQAIIRKMRKDVHEAQNEARLANIDKEKALQEAQFAQRKLGSLESQLKELEALQADLIKTKEEVTRLTLELEKKAATGGKGTKIAQGDQAKIKALQEKIEVLKKKHAEELDAAYSQVEDYAKMASDDTTRLELEQTKEKLTRANEHLEANDGLKAQLDAQVKEANAKIEQLTKEQEIMTQRMKEAFERNVDPNEYDKLRQQNASLQQDIEQAKQQLRTLTETYTKEVEVLKDQLGQVTKLEKIDETLRFKRAFLADAQGKADSWWTNSIFTSEKTRAALKENVARLEQEIRELEAEAGK